MKRRDIIKRLQANGFVLKRNNDRHDIYYNSVSKRTVPVGHHREIPDHLARRIFGEAGLK